MTHDSGLAPFNAPTVASSTPLLAFRACPVCSVPTQATELQRLRDFQFFTDGDAPRVDLIDVQCTHCFACYKNPTYTDEGMRVLFAKAGASYGSAQPTARAQEQAAWVRVRCPDATAVLDYGCGGGEFLHAYEGPAHFGVELPPMLQAAIDKEHPLIPGRFASTLNGLHGVPMRGVDVITLWHVLEHVADPIALLTQLRESFSWGQTVLIVEVPTLEHAETADLCGFFTPMHTTHFSRQSLLNVLGRSGWEALSVSQCEYNGVRCVCRPLPHPHGAPLPFAARGVIGHADDVSMAARLLAHQDATRVAVAERLVARTQGKSVALWGAGLHTELLYQWAGLAGHMPTILFDTDPTKQQTTWRGVRIIKPTGWDADDWEFTRLVISSYGSQAAIHAAAVALDIPRSAIVTLYDDPVAY